MPCTPGLTPDKFCIGIEKRKQYFANLWVVTKVYYGQYKSGLYNEPYNLKLNLKPTNRPKTPRYKIFTVTTLGSLLQKQYTLHSSTFPIGKVSCKLGRHKYLIIGFYGK